MSAVTSIGQGVPGNEGTSPDKGTAAPGSNFTRDEKESDKAPDDGKSDDVDESPDGSGSLMEGTRRGPAQPS